MGIMGWIKSECQPVMVVVIPPHKLSCIEPAKWYSPKLCIATILLPMPLKKSSTLYCFNAVIAIVMIIAQ